MVIKRHPNARILLLACLVIIMMACAGCQPKSSFPYGTYTSEDGTYQWVLSEDGSTEFSFSKSGKVISAGTFSVQGDEVTWETDSYCDAIKPRQATYTWTFKDDKLVFKVIGADICSSRHKVIQNKPYYLNP